ncbi:MAG TPA: YkvA family protein [Anaerolineae bacterium]|nr:YkvA family protein [Anaerolineae bacterium]
MTVNNSDRRSPGFWMNLFNSFRIAWKLMWDNQVPIAAKIVPVLTILYVLSPIDFIPDFLVGLGQLDDLAILILGVQAFIAVSPKDVVARIRAEIEGRPPDSGWTVTGNQPHDPDQPRSSASDDIIDG